MKFARKALAASVLAATASMSAQAIQIDQDNRGQLLLAPIYAAANGQTTEFRVVNPSLDIAVKAHVSFRSAENSLDLLNFLLYLSPGDEWIGTVKTDTDGRVVLVSDDDSMLVGYTDANGGTDGTPTTGKFPSPAAPHTQPLFKSTFPDTRTLGHVEILGVYAVYNDNDAIGNGANRSYSANNENFIARAMPKEILFDIDNVVFNSAAAANPETITSGGGQTTTVGGVNKGGMYDGYLPVPSTHPTNFNDTANCISSNGIPVYASGVNVETSNNNTEDYCLDTSDDRIQLFGEVVVKLADKASPFHYHMIALDDTAAPADANGDGDVLDLDDRTGVIDNPLFDVVTENDVPLGVRFGAVNDIDLTGAPGAVTAITATGQATDNINMIDRALSAASFIGTYDSMEKSVNNTNTDIPAGDAESLLIVTFPTKYRHLPANSPDYATVNQINASETSSFRGLDVGIDPITIGSLPTTTTLATFIDYVNDNASSDRNTNDYDTNLSHYDYDYGFRQELYNMIQEFNDGAIVANGMSYWNHYGANDAAGLAAAGNSPAVTYTTNTSGMVTAVAPVALNAGTGSDSFIFGTRDAACNGTAQVQYTVTSYDTHERRFTPAQNFTTDVFSGDIGSGQTVAPTGIPFEVNLVSDTQSGVANSLWYSTKGWYQVSFADMCTTTLGSVANAANRSGVAAADDAMYANEAALVRAPVVVMTLTTDANGNSRIVPAHRND
ncbi:hypothetical protein D5085_03490 [Ectothiorhodospiraceae bacterium BW-2]|nr:hypothetical protein D5085_03490 [Ectothiorhodospiraceae bacterium BW-2]